MKLEIKLGLAAVVLAALPARASDDVIALGKSIYEQNCAVCHGDYGKGGGSLGELLREAPPDLTAISKIAGGKFPIVRTYNVIVGGLKIPAHGSEAMPVWGRYFMAEALQDQGASIEAAAQQAAGRALSLVLYLESIQE